MWTGAEIDAAITEHTELVRRIAWRLNLRLPASVDLDDLVQDGMIGLLDAATSFDPKRGTSFPAFAAERIHGAMLDQMRVNDWVPRTARAAQRAIDRARDAAAQKLGRAPTAIDVASELQMPVEALQRLVGRVRAREMLSIEDLYSEEGGGWLERNAAGDEATGPLAVLEQNQLQARLAATMLTLTDRERILMSMLYVEDLNMAQAGVRLGVTEARVSQIRAGIVRKLRRGLGITATA